MSNELTKGNPIANSLDMDDYEVKPDLEDEIVELKPKQPDFEGVQQGIKTATEIGEKALFEISNIAHQSQHPRNYEALTELLKAVVVANKELLEIQKTQQDIEDKAGHNPRQQVTHNTMIVGSTKEMSEYLKKMKEEK
jgi:hypothetical protein